MIKKAIKYALKTTLPVWKTVLSRKCMLDSDSARKNLEAFSRKPVGTPVAKNTLAEFTCDLQIIIPAYNVESYLKECLDSVLFQETQYTYKIVLINDGSTDNTTSIAEQYSHNDKVIVLHQENKGFSGARNTGLQNLFARYVMFVDSDDKLCPGAIEALLHTAFEYDCDIVEGGALALRGNGIQNYFSHAQTKAIPTPLGVFHGQPWAKVFKSSYFEKIAFPEGFWFEDTIMTFLLYQAAERCFVTDKNVYTYRINPNGISCTFGGKPKSLDSYWVTESVMEACAQLQYPFNEASLDNFLYQITINQKRVSRLPELIQQSAFVLSAEMVNNYYSTQIIEKHEHSEVLQALLTRNWGLFRILCRVY